MPPRFGKLDLATWAKSAPTINGYKTEPWILKGAKILTINMEIDDDPADNLIPATMHPSIPEYAIFCVTTYPEISGGRVLDCRGPRLGPHRRASARIRAAQLLRQ